MIKAPHVEGLLSIATRWVDDAEQYYLRSRGSEDLAMWGGRTQTLLKFLESRVMEKSLNELLLHSLWARSHAMLDQLDDAAALLEKLPTTNEENPHLDETLFVDTYRDVVLAMQHFHGSVHTLEWLTFRWDEVSCYLGPRKVVTRADLKHVKSFRETVLKVIDHIEFPAMFLAERRYKWPPDRRRIVAQYLVQALSELQLPLEANHVVEEMQRQSITPSIPSLVKLIKALVFEEAFGAANALYSTLQKSHEIEPFSEDILEIGLYLYAHQGDALRAKERFRLIDQEANLKPNDIALMLHAYAVNGKTAEAITLFEKRFVLDKSDPESLLFKPNIYHFTEVIFAHAQRGDVDGMTKWLAKMHAYGFAPDAVVYSIILKSFAMRGDVDSISSLLVQMESAGYPPTKHDYTTIISLLARRQDAASAEVIYKRAVTNGVVPDRYMMNALMHAHVEAGSWDGVIRVFDYMTSSSNRRHRPSVAVFNTLLKAYVLIGAPFQVVSTVFSKLEGVGIQPTARTYALFIQSACDSGHMDIACELLVDMDKRFGKGQTDLRANIHILTIIMGGFLRQGNKTRAKQIYDEMKDRDLSPTAVTLGMITNSYGNEKSLESKELVEDFLKAMVGGSPSACDWNVPTRGRKSALETLYTPLMNSYAQEQRPEDIERLMEDMVQAGEEPSLAALTALLHGYSRSGDIESARHVWLRIFPLALRLSQVHGLTGEGQRRPQSSNILCVPLSIYIDALSAGGCHSDVVDVWEQVRDNHFTLDPHNWNHYVVALVRAGEAENAFKVLETIILPRSRAPDSRLSPRKIKPEVIYTFDGGVLPHQLAGSPKHWTDRRVRTVGIATKELNGWLSEEKHSSGDFAQPLHVLHQASPSWTIWNPHSTTLGVLSKVIEQLSSGRPLKAVVPGDGTSARRSRVLETLEQEKERRGLAKRLLRRIYANFPEAVRAVEDYERREQSLGQRRLEIDQDIVWR